MPPRFDSLVFAPLIAVAIFVACADPVSSSTMTADASAPDELPNDASTAQPDEDRRTTQPPRKKDSGAPAKDAGAANDGGSLGDGGLTVCHSVAQVGPVSQNVIGTVPAPQGGTISPGTYVLVRVIRSAPKDEAYRFTMRFDGAKLETTESNAANTFHRRSSWSFSTSGTTLTMTRTCKPTSGDPTHVEMTPYTATATVLTVFESSQVAMEFELVP